MNRLSLLVQQRAVCPKVMSAFLAPSFKSASPAFRASSTVLTGTPVISVASVSFGVT